MDEIKIKFKIAGILAREENNLLDRSEKLTDIFNILKEQLILSGVVGQSEQLSDKKVMTIDEWMKVHKITPYKTSCDVNGRVACKSMVEEWYKQYVDRTKA